VTEAWAQEHAAGLSDAEVGSQFEQRDCNAIVKIQIQKDGAALQQAIPLLHIVLMKLLERYRCSMHCDGVEIIPAEAAHPAIIVSLAAKVEAVQRQRGKLGYWTGREQGDGNPFAARVLASYPGDAF